MKNPATQLAFVITFLLISIGAHAEDKKVSPNETALVLENMASQNKTEAEFGIAVRKQSLLAAAREFAGRVRAPASGWPRQCRQ